MAKHPFKRSKKDLFKKQVIILYQAGNSFRNIASLLKVSHETVRQIWLSTQVKDVA